MSDTSFNSAGEEKRTVGEELYLIHLSRFSKEERSPDDYDHETSPLTKIPGHKPTLGEELWRIHCKRSQGMIDVDHEEMEYGAAKRHDPVSPTPKGATTPGRKKLATRRNINVKPRIIHLRNRDIPIA